MQSIQKVAYKVQKKLVEAGFVVQRYDAQSTNSVYLKLDFGMCNSIRISDHHSKQHLHYRYNLSTLANKKYTDRGGKYPRYYYPFSEWYDMIEAIKKRRTSKIEELSAVGYVKEMYRFKEQNENSKGFWEQACIINDVKW